MPAFTSPLTTATRARARPGFWARWDRLVGHVLQGGVVPFLGAGVSRDARCIGDTPSVVPTIDCLREDVVSALVEALHARPLDLVAVQRELGLEDHQSFFNADFTRLAEVLTWYSDPMAPVRSTRIQDYEHLLPLPAHRAIARIAREGLFDEVITTNYDLCLERAWRNTLPADRRLNDDPAHRDDRKGWHPAVIRSLGEHRQRGSRRECQHGFPVLRIYKVNGCAERLGRGLTQDAQRACAEIILTEPQLRDFGARGWARDLLRDRARSAHLLFSGFGSDEPQVRFTMLDLLAELSHDGEGRQGEPALWDEGNAPWIQGFEAHLSYPQAQLLRGYRDARLDHREAGPLDTDSINAFLGGDGNTLDAGTQTGLTADLFWTRLHQGVWGRLLAKNTARDSAIHSWLSELGIDAQAWLASLRSWLYPQTSAANGARDDDGFAVLASRVGQLLELTGDPGLSPSSKPMDQRPACPPLWRWLAAVSGVDITRDHRSGNELCPAEQDYYLAWRDDPVLIALVLLLAWLALAGQEQPLSGTSATATEGLRVPIHRAAQEGSTAGSDRTPLSWLLIRGEGAHLPDLSGETRSLIVVTVPSRHGRGEAGSTVAAAPPSMRSTSGLKQRVAVRQEPLTVAWLLRALDTRVRRRTSGDSAFAIPALLRADLWEIVSSERVDLHRSRLILLRSAS